ncbi:hypothetical protein BBP40_009388 [Aspergillus hancockii]|nr:hypothetical protein BBP40_009388 [Aspergillus hancockii]
MSAPTTDPIKITTPQLLTLLTALITLKCLQAMAFLLRHDQTRHIHPIKSPVTRAIIRKENLITDIFLSIMPESLFRSPDARPEIGHHTRLTPEDAHLSLPTFTRKGTTDLNSISTKESQTSSCVANALVRIAPLRPAAIRISPCASRYCSLHLDWSDKAVAGAGVEGNGRSSLQAPRAKDEDCAPLKGSSSLALVRSQSERAVNVPRRNTCPSTMDCSRSLVERRQFGPLARLWMVDSVVVPLEEDSRAILEMEEGRGRSRSVESCPGGFPVCGGLEQDGSLDIMRGRGVTTVRPFSDL